MTDPNRPVTGYPAPNPNGAAPPPSNTSYAYAAPPPPYYNHQQYYPQNYQPDPYAAQRAKTLRRIFAFIIAAIIIAGTIIFIIWLVLRPRLPEFRVDSLSVSNFNISATFDLRLTARNPNKKVDLAYDNIEAVVFYQSNALSKTTLPPFTQSTRNETAMQALFAPLGTYVNRDIVDRINGERNRSGNIGFNVRMRMMIRFKAGAWRARRRYLKVFCGELAVAVSNGANGTFLGGPRQCRVGL